jgi:deoxyhypusine synthase
MQADYSTVMPFLVRGLLDNRERYEKGGEEIAEEQRGYLRPRAGYRLFEKRAELVERLTADVRENGDWLKRTLHYSFAADERR